MANPTIDISVTETKANPRWNLPVWLVLVCVVTFSVLLGAGAAIWKNAPPVPAVIPVQFSIWSIVSVFFLIGAIAPFLFIYMRSPDDSVLPTGKSPVIPQITSSQKVTSCFYPLCRS